MSDRAAFVSKLSGRKRHLVDISLDDLEFFATEDNLRGYQLFVPQNEFKNAVRDEIAARMDRKSAN